MISVSHHNHNVDAEETGERVVIRQRPRISRANDAPNPRIHKTLITSWQKRIISTLKMEDDNLENEVEEIENEFENLRFDHEDIPEDANLDEYFEDFIVNNVIY